MRGPLTSFVAAEFLTSVGTGRYYPYALPFYDGLAGLGLPLNGSILGGSAS